MSYEIFTGNDCVLIRDEGGGEIRLSFEDARSLRRDKRLPASKNKMSPEGSAVHAATGRANLLARRRLAIA